MKMKKHLFAFTLLLITFSGFSQDKKSMEERAWEMYEITVNGEFETLIMDYTYPRLFEIVPRDKAVEGMQSMLNGNEQYKMIIMDTPPNFIFGEIKKIEGGYYALIKHDFKMKMIFNEAMEEDVIQYTISLFKEGMKTDNVTFDAKENSFTIFKQSELIAASDKYTNNVWMFTNKTKNELMAKMFNEEIRKQLGL